MGGRGCEGDEAPGRGGGGEAARLRGCPPTGGGDPAGRGNPRWLPSARGLRLGLIGDPSLVVLTLLKVLEMVGCDND